MSLNLTNEPELIFYTYFTFYIIKYCPINFFILSPDTGQEIAATQRSSLELLTSSVDLIKKKRSYSVAIFKTEIVSRSNRICKGKQKDMSTCMRYQKREM